MDFLQRKDQRHILTTLEYIQISAFPLIWVPIVNNAGRHWFKLLLTQKIIN